MWHNMLVYNVQKHEAKRDLPECQIQEKKKSDISIERLWKKTRYMDTEAEETMNVWRLTD